MGEEKEILLRGKVCAYLTWRLMGDPSLHAHTTSMMEEPKHAFDRPKVLHERCLIFCIIKIRMLQDDYLEFT